MSDVYKCVLCKFSIQDPSDLKKVHCMTCPDPEKSFNYICPVCKNPLLKIQDKS